MAKNEKQITPEVMSIIEEAIKKTAALMIAEKNAQPDDCYKQTIKRMRAIPILKERIRDNTARLDGPLQGKSTSIVRYSADGVRADPEEMLEAVRRSLSAHIEADRAEVDEVETAMAYIGSDYYFPAVYDSYILGKSDAEIAEQLHCEDSTVRRNRGRLTRIIAVRLYGVLAI